MVKTRAGSKPQPTNKNIISSFTKVQKANTQSRKTLINLNSQELKFTLTSSTSHSQKKGYYMENNSQASNSSLMNSTLYSRKQEPRMQPNLQPSSLKKVNLMVNSRMHESRMQIVSQAPSASSTGQTRMQCSRVQTISQVSKPTSLTSPGQTRMQGSCVQPISQDSKPTSTTNSILLSRMQGSRMSTNSAQSTAVAKPSVESGKNSGLIPDSVEKETIRLKEVEPIICEPFDFTTVRTEYQYKDPPKGSRKKDILEAPVLYPTPEEFRDPYAYIESIAHIGHRYGIIKIVPPEGWRPPFVLNTEEFKFSTRKQTVNTMEGQTRVKLNYLQQLQMFHAQQGKKNFVKPPLVDRTPIDLHLLAKVVEEKGGPEEISNKKQWAEVARAIRPDGYSAKCTSLSKTIKEKYQEIVEPYETYIADVKAECREGRSINLQTDPDSDSDHMDIDEEVCGECENIIRSDPLICEGDCQKAFHAKCLKIKRSQIHPGASWHCPKCLFLYGTKFGFDPSETYTLKAFQQIADDFRQRYLKKRPVPQGVSVEDHVENEFWRLAMSADHDTEILYGADNSSIDYGSGFPCPKAHSSDPYSRDPWNLRNFPKLPGSLLSHIRPAIPGMMIPWLYVGMMFSAFCWHVEDHYTYSINYMHWGETKTWYGVPAASAAKFEAAAGRLLPELFQNQPDLLSQLTTILNPIAIIGEGIDVFAIDQRPNQFVITFPQAYHAGFNHGLNFNEAVNFALPDWVEFGQKSVNYYKKIRRDPVFSHEKLLVDIGLKKINNFKVLSRLKESLIEVCQSELRRREEVTSRLRLPEANYDLTDPKDDETLCAVCRSWTGLSALQFNCTKKVLCLECACVDTDTCCCENPCYYLRVRYSDRHLKSLAQRVKDLMQLRKDRYKALIKHVNKVNTLALEQLAPIIEINRTYRFGLPLARNIWPNDYQDVPLNEFDITDFLYQWDCRLRNVYRAGNDRKNYFCFCRGEDYGGKMICCDKCDVWYHCECINMKSEDTLNYEHWYCAMCRAPRTARIKIDENVRRIETLANEAENLRINLPCISASFVTEINAELKKLLSGNDIHSVRIGVGLGFGLPLDGSVEFEEGVDDVDLSNFMEDNDLNSKFFGNIEANSKNPEDSDISKRNVENFNLGQHIENDVETRKRKAIQCIYNLYIAIKHHNNVHVLIRSTYIKYISSLLIIC
ncbi:lysine-specific demethylase lid-like [Rhizophagus clarus]|uniref:[histone H3]-trimethyl-L-lysine(4) demethylase n=1 Tax=Rhizophagus clarus TaxID=94130 RepID=A0A8H3KZE3_9GLOM|nr:lysine-specific demethylase lid-like [Rhizophagus clarus]